MQTTKKAESEEQRAKSLSKAALRHEMWRRRRKVIAEVREMPVWDAADAANVTMLGNAYNELRQKALHLARIAEKDMEEHQRRIDGWKKAQAGKPMLRGKGGRGE